MFSNQSAGMFSNESAGIFSNQSAGMFSNQSVGVSEAFWFMRSQRCVRNSAEHMCEHAVLQCGRIHTSDTALKDVLGARLSSSGVLKKLGGHT
jgi:hypothetical protein